MGTATKGFLKNGVWISKNKGKKEIKGRYIIYCRECQTKRVGDKLTSLCSCGSNKLTISDMERLTTTYLPN